LGTIRRTILGDRDPPGERNLSFEEGVQRTNAPLEHVFLVHDRDDDIDTDVSRRLSAPRRDATGMAGHSPPHLERHATRPPIAAEHASRVGSGKKPAAIRSGRAIFSPGFAQRKALADVGQAWIRPSLSLQPMTIVRRMGAYSRFQSLEAPQAGRGNQTVQRA
jgi:hypothetical protein